MEKQIKIEADDFKLSMNIKNFDKNDCTDLLRLFETVLRLLNYNIRDCNKLMITDIDDETLNRLEGE